mmetsp:Transcript_20734/g.30552  ORF Transcript_20734/g.30552 Transcript_20734/m.30552 type:complete len:461 (-) Transcript_20734:100-1482(-)|eukprot:CAMPEP_0195521812 /NCGR_PEP_ID=MMETSP0794_2-20130614/19408_1 /TAXON_ID=515487 /ORGANISM="Stephanopyxis turris, Strain CCMP 815" /LENGTH=460 /DNA_ID=CAMNT_0040651433 /DNA_START=79 /DNA_END=1461 /DNA_ORIENTATION=+
MYSQTREPELHRLIARGNIVTYRILTDWPAIIARCTSHPHEASWLDRRRRTALHSACTKRPPVDAIRALVNACGGRDIVEKPDKHGRTPLVLAVETGSPGAVVRLLLEIHPEAVSKQDAYGHLPLHRACYNRASDAVVRMLLECYPEAASKEIKGGTPLDLAIESGSSEAVIKMLINAYPEAALNDKPGSNPLLTAIRKRASFNTIKMLVDANRAAVFKGKRGCLPLHEAIEYRVAAEVIKLLCDVNENAITATNKIHQTPLHLAINMNSSLEILKILLEKAPQAARVSHHWVKSPLEMSCEIFSKTANTTVETSADLVGSVGKSWERVLLLLSASYHGNISHPVPNTMSWRVVHAATSFNLPDKVLQTAMALFPHQVKETDDDGRLPLNIASENGMMWNSGLRTIFNAYPNALGVLDPTSGLYPFMAVAQVKEKNDLVHVNTVYELLLAGPDLIRDGMK